MSDEQTMGDDDIRRLLRRLARRHPSGGKVVERAAILAEGGDFDAIMAWIAERGGGPEEAVATTAVRRGLHGSRLHETGAASRTPARFVIPAGVLD
jgi:predicted type IV restriction endonuclease